jgi:hypothetical protein
MAEEEWVVKQQFGQVVQVVKQRFGEEQEQELVLEPVLLGLEPVPESAEQVKGMQRRLVQQAFLVKQQFLTQFLRLQQMIEQQLGEVEL